MSTSRTHSDPTKSLKDLIVLRELSASALTHLAAECRWSQYTPGQEIVSYLAPTTHVYFLVTGRVRVAIWSADGKPVHFNVLEAPAMFGEIAAIDRGPRSASVEALDACTVGVLSAEQFEQLLLREPSVALATCRQLVRDVRNLSERVLEFSTLAVRSRIHGELLRLGLAAGERDGVSVLSPAPSLLDLASRVSTHREAASRELSRLTALGIIKRNGGDLRILDMPRLRSLVREARGDE